MDRSSQLPITTEVLISVNVLLTELGHIFISSALNAMRLRYNNEDDEAVFVFVSDDILWARRNFAQSDDVVFAEDFNDPEKERDPKIFDLVILAMCNHTIIG